uniref:Uncharacterized protein n=1 Tax=Seriola dumerili TaxID=41447 RepID=A0A3B4VP13_SERDU
MNPGFSLTKAVEDVSKQGYTQIETNLLCFLFQTTLSNVEMKGKKAEQELRSRVREILVLEGDMEHLEQQTKVLHDRCVSISKENAELQIRTREEEEKARVAREGFDTYRQKMEGHRAAVLHAASRTEVHKKLEEKKALVRMLTRKKEELKKDLENPNGDTVHMAKVKIMILNYTEILNFMYYIFCFCFPLIRHLFFCICFSAERD